MIRMLQQEKKGKKGQKQGSGSSLQTVQQTRSPEERFRMKQEAQAQGVQEPDAAFEQRLDALRKSATSRTQVHYRHACSLYFHISETSSGGTCIRHCPVGTTLCRSNTPSRRISHESLGSLTQGLLIGAISHYFACSRCPLLHEQALAMPALRLMLGGHACRAAPAQAALVPAHSAACWMQCPTLAQLLWSKAAGPGKGCSSKLHSRRLVRIAPKPLGPIR